MSSQPDRAVSAPALSVESSSTSESAVESGHKTAPIRIGSQRDGVKPPAAVAKPVLPAPPVAAVAPAFNDTAEEASEVPSDAAGPAASQRGGANRAARREHGGGSKSRAAQPLVEPQYQSKYPPPNTRGQLSADLEMEYMAALGGEPLEAIIAGGTTNIVAELEPESRHKGKVISVHRDNVFMEIGGRQQGLLPLKNFAAPPEPGAVVDVMVSRFNAVDGLYELVLPGATVDVGEKTPADVEELLL